MPYKSLAQAAYMHIHHPEVAKEFDRKTPEHVGDKKKVSRKKPYEKRGK